MAKAAKRKGILDFFNINNSGDDDFDDDLFDEDEYEADDDYDSDDLGDSYDDGYDDYDDEYDTPQPVKSKTSPFKSMKTYTGRSSGTAKSQTASGRQSRSSRPSGNGKLVPISGRNAGMDDNEVFVIKPDEFDDAQLIIDHLNRGQIIIINMEELDLPTAQRIADFIGGASYAINGLFYAISGNIFMATPNGTYVSGDLREEVEEASSRGQSGYSERASY